MPTDPDLPLVFSRADALRAGLSRHQIAGRVGTGRWTRLRQGRYTVTARHSRLDARQQHLVAVAALLSCRPPEDVASHLSAAAALGWALPLDGAGRPTLTSPSGTGPTRGRADLVVQVAGLGERDVVELRRDVGGHALSLRCTTAARTLADLLRHLPVPDSVAIADDALRRGEVDASRVAAVLRQQQAWPYAARSAAAMALIDPRRETWLESYSFVQLAQAGLPLPEPQVCVHDERGRFVGRVDGWWDDVAVALEPDGRGKYLIGLGDLPADLEHAADDVAHHVRRVLLRQQERQARLEDLGVVVVRWSTHEAVRTPQVVAARAARARERGDRRTFTGSVVRSPSPVAGSVVRSLSPAAGSVVAPSEPIRRAPEAALRE